MKRILFFIAFSVFAFAGENHSLLRFEKNPYISYVQTLIKDQNLTTNDIKNLLAKKRLTVRGSILKGLHEQYYKKDIKNATYYFDEVLNKAPDKIKNTSSAPYLADFLAYQSRFSEINKILSLDYCNTLLSEEEGKCVYYVFLGKKYSNQETLLEEKILSQKKYLNYKKILQETKELL